MPLDYEPFRPQPRISGLKVILIVIAGILTAMSFPFLFLALERIFPSLF